MKRRRSSRLANKVDKKLKSVEPSSIYQLHQDGFEIHTFPKPSDFLIDEIKEIGDKGYIIFNNRMNGGDDKRSQTFVNKCNLSHEFKNWTNCISRILAEGYFNLTPRDMVILKSKAGCKRQLAHCDYEQDIVFARCPDSHVPLGCLICIMEGTTIDIWPRSIRLPTLHTELTDKIDPIPRTSISLLPGQMLVFRGDLVHAGSAYPGDNYRLHIFLDSDLVPRNPNRTYYMHKDNYILDGI